MADSPVDRRSFFRLGLKRVLGSAVDVMNSKMSAGDYMRPPGALPEAAFLAACTRCGECERVCPVHAIRPLGTTYGLAAGTPVLNVALTACAMCEDMPCAAACPTDALDTPIDGWKNVRIAKIDIDEDRCVAFRDIECGVCVRVCPVGDAAIRLRNGRPVLGADCTGCGTCVNACVTTPSSISAQPPGKGS